VEELPFICPVVIAVDSLIMVTLYAIGSEQPAGIR
jgi:hypothetical protein